ncbi:MAG: FtsQ-type POTRA domain-containing protein [Clostridia bacterium]|nr:FtsQ-type POTRA domain-containing protein [Clostridia bacterium]
MTRTENGNAEKMRRQPQRAAECRQNAAKEHREGSRKLLKILLVLLSAALVWGMLSWLLSLVPLRKVRVEGLTRYGEEEVLIAAGLATADKLLSVDAETVRQNLTAFYPYIETVKVRYAFPLGYRLVINEDTPAYYTRIADDYFALSAELKVLERATSPRRFLEEGLQQITLSGIQTAMLGQTLDYGGDYLDRILRDVHASVLADRITDVHVGDRYHLSVVCDGLYTLYLGDTNAIDAKLRLAALMLEEADIPAGYGAVLDVSDLKKTSIRFEGIKDGALEVSE